MAKFPWTELTHVRRSHLGWADGSSNCSDDPRPKGQPQCRHCNEWVSGGEALGGLKGVAGVEDPAVDDGKLPRRSPLGIGADALRLANAAGVVWSNRLSRTRRCNQHDTEHGQSHLSQGAAARALRSAAQAGNDRAEGLAAVFAGSMTVLHVEVGRGTAGADQPERASRERHQPEGVGDAACRSHLLS